MKRRYTQTDVDRAREEYQKWDTFGAGSETAIELAKRLGIGRTTLYKWRDRGWQLTEGSSHDGIGTRSVDLAPVVRYLTDELVESRALVSQLQAEVAALNDVLEKLQNAAPRGHRL
jgi:transposase-like protein